MVSILSIFVFNLNFLLDSSSLSWQVLSSVNQQRDVYLSIMARAYSENIRGVLPGVPIDNSNPQPPTSVRVVGADS